jgi:hypothetical protein
VKLSLIVAAPGISPSSGRTTATFMPSGEMATMPLSPFVVICTSAAPRGAPPLRLPLPHVPLVRSRKKLSESMPWLSSSYALLLSISANVANRSMCTSGLSQTAPAGVTRGQRTKNGTRCPPSKWLALVPRKLPLEL